MSAPYPPLEPPRIEARFPDPRPGEDVVAVSRSMSPALVLEAYRNGIFPWPVRQGLVPWASPDPRAIFPLQPAHPWPRTVRRAFKPSFRVSVDEAFEPVMRACAEREGQGTWITPDILLTYGELHRLAGIAARRLQDIENLRSLSRVFWFSLEFGVVVEAGELRAYGAGILSS